MSKSHVVAQYLPYLRRYARAVTGSQTSGDAYVAATLEALVKQPQLLESEDLPQVTLFRLFLRIPRNTPRLRNATLVRSRPGRAKHFFSSRLKDFPRRTPREFSTSMHPPCASSSKSRAASLRRRSPRMS